MIKENKLGGIGIAHSKIDPFKALSQLLTHEKVKDYIINVARLNTDPSSFFS